MAKSPKVIFNYRFELAINNPDRKRTSKKNIIKRTTKMFDYYSNEEKKAMGMFDYYIGNLTKNETMNLVLENGKYATKEEIEKRKIQYTKYIENSNLAKCVISFNNDYINNNITIKKLEQTLIKEVLPKFFKKCGYVNVNNMSYQLACHTDTDNLHFHISFIEKKPNYRYVNNKIGYKRKGVISETEINFIKNQVELSIEREKIYTPLLIKTNKEIDVLKKYFNPNEKNYLLYDKKDLILENNILLLGKLLYDKRYGENKRIKYNSIKNKEIKEMTKNIKNYIFSKNNNNFKNEYNNFKESLNKINDIFVEMSKNNNISKKRVDNSLVNNKSKYLDNYIYNSIVNHANYLFRTKKKNVISENDIIQEIILKDFIKNKKQTRYDILYNYLSNNKYSKKFKNKTKIETAIKNINYEMEEAQKEFSKLFMNDYSNNCNNYYSMLN